MAPSDPLSPTTASLSYPQRTSASTYRVPRPPRIVVPPPSLNADMLPDIPFSTLPHSSFLNNGNYANLIPKNSLQEWTYEQRREAQKILPYLYLGPMTAAKDEAFLRKEGITCIVAVRQKGAFSSKLMNGALSKAESMGVQTRTIDLLDNQELISSFPATTALVYDHVREHHQQTGQLGKVLVFCESGNERSAGVVAAFLMETHADVDFIKAMQLCQAQRFCANFDDAMKMLLQGYWDIICAKRAVAAQSQSMTAANAGNGGVLSTKGKRAFSRDRDGDEEMNGMPSAYNNDNEDDMERFGGRSFVPFVDAADLLI